MTTHELARKLLEGPDVRVVVRGYEGGVNDVSEISEPSPIALNISSKWYLGAHELNPYKEVTTETAIELRGVNENAN